MSETRHNAIGFDYKPETWMDTAACVGYPSEWWFPDDRGQAGAAGSSTTQTALALCATCPVQTRCLDYALTVEAGWNRFGIYGGLTGEQRRELAKDVS